jgi:predicted phage-related endonuclease
MTTDREQWLASRRHFCTASDVAAMLNENPYKTRDQLRMEKLGLDDGWQGDESSRNAERLEVVALQWAEEDYGWRTKHNRELLVDSVCPRLAATPDAWMDSPWGLCNVQVKTTRSAAQEDCRQTTKGGKPSSAMFLNGAPLHYQLQVQAEMAVLGAAHSVLLVMHLTPIKLRAYYVPRHDPAIARIRREVAKFWEEIEASK